MYLLCKMKIKLIYILLLIVILPVHSWGQDDNYSKKYPRRSTSKIAKELSKSLEESNSDKEIAENYISLAKELSEQKEYARSESYYLQAINLFTKNKNNEPAANAYRELAKIQEIQNKFEEAISNYINASLLTNLKDFREINVNDAERLRNRNNPQTQTDYIQRNLQISQNTGNKEETANSYQQMAQVKRDMDDNQGAREELKNALQNVKEKPRESFKIKQEIAKTYISENQYEEAIDINKDLLEEAKQVSDTQLEIEQLQNLSSTYFEAKDAKSGINTLKEAYNLAIRNGETMQARNILNSLVEEYRKLKNTSEILAVYADFTARLDTLIKSDSSLVDAKLFQLHENRISQLEKERELKDELIAKKNRFNYILLFLITLILIFIAFIIRSLYSINRKNKKIALQSLRREMNPHFIFNSLNSVNHFIAQNNEIEANKYLSSYSRLMRSIMENSNKDFISLSNELEHLKEYLELEHMRFRDKFYYEIHLDDSIDSDAVYIPNMLIQPQLENAIWHGLRYKESMGKLTLRISKEKDRLSIVIEDDGIGIKKSKELKTRHQRQHNSRGLTNTQERISLLNQLYHIHITMEINDKKDKENSGVIVIFRFPLIDKKIANDEHYTKN